MCVVKVRFADVLSTTREVDIPAEKFSDIPRYLEKNDEHSYAMIFIKIRGRVKVKSYISVFVNNHLLLDDDIALSNGDVVAMTVAIAGG